MNMINTYIIKINSRNLIHNYRLLSVLKNSFQMIPKNKNRTHIFCRFFKRFLSVSERVCARKKMKMLYQKVWQRFGTDVMVRPNYSVLDIEYSVQTNLGSVGNLETRFARTE